MPSFGSVTSDQLGADGVGELVGVADDDPDVGAPFAVCEPAPGLAALLAVAGLVVAVAAVFFDSEHPAIVPIRRNAVKTATTPGRRRRRRGGAVKLPTLCARGGVFSLYRRESAPLTAGTRPATDRATPSAHRRRARPRTPLRPGQSRPTRGSRKRRSVAALPPKATAVRGSSHRGSARLPGAGGYASTP